MILSYQLTHTHISKHTHIPKHTHTDTLLHTYQNIHTNTHPHPITHTHINSDKGRRRRQCLFFSCLSDDLPLDSSWLPSYQLVSVNDEENHSIEHWIQQCQQPVNERWVNFSGKIRNKSQNVVETSLFTANI